MQIQGAYLFAVCSFLGFGNIYVQAQWNLDPYNRIQTCATLFENHDYSGNKTEIKAGSLITDTSTISLWNITNSFSIESECILTICNTNLSSEDCNKFNKSFNEELPLKWYSESIVVHCGCQKKCSCENLLLRKTECARAYLENDCDSCNAFYTNLEETEKGETKILPQQFQSKVTAIKVKTGCTVKILNGTNLQAKVTGATKKYDWSQEFTDYQCRCDTRVTQKRRIAHEIEPNLPPLVEIPKLSGAINVMLNGQYKNHPGLVAGLQSLSNKRSSRNAYIFLLGLTGSGKSTTINFLFDNSNITKVGDIHSTTTHIHEYRIPIPVNEIGIANSELRIIDTPGIVDTRGLEQDAKYLATLDEFLKTHEDLKRSIPNVVLVFLKFNENRFSGYGSSFVKMLRTIDLFRDRLVDKTYSNVIFVATHFMSETKEITRKPFERLQALRKVIEEYSLLPKPILIALAENKPEKSDLLSINGFYTLPNGQFYPKNLFDKIQQVTSNGGDPIGESIIRTAFKYCDLENVTEIITPLVSETHSKVTKYLGVLSSLNRNPQKTEISQKLEETFEIMPSEYKINPAEASIMLGNLQRTFYLNHFLTIDDLPKTKTDLSNFLKTIPKNPISIYLLQNSLNISIPIYEPANLIGYNYNLLEDSSLVTSPLKLDFNNEEDLLLSDIGYRLPNIYKCDLRSRVRTVFHSFTSNGEYFNHRMNSLLNSIEDGLPFPEELFDGFNSLKPGLNLIEMDKEDSLNQLNAIIEYESFQLSLDEDLIELNDEFQSAIENIVEFNETNWDSVNSWKEFFKKYSTHLVTSCAGGGSIEIKVKINTENNNNNETEFNSLSDLFIKQEILSNGMSKVIDFIANLMIGKETLLDTEGIEYIINFKGGNYKYFISNLSDPNARIKIMNWKNSLEIEPIMIEGSKIELMPLNEIVNKKLGSEISTKLKSAELSLLNASLIYKPKKVKEFIIPFDRDQVDMISDGGGGNDYAVMKEFVTMFQTLADKSRQANEQLVNIVLQSKLETEKLIAQDDDKRTKHRQQVAEANEEMFRQIQAQQIAQMEHEQILAGQRAQEQANYDATYREGRRIEQEQTYLAQKAADQRNEKFLAFVQENNRRIDESRKSSFWNKLTDGVVKGIVSSLPTLIAGVAATG